MTDPMTPERLAQLRARHEAGHDISYVAQGQLLAEVDYERAHIDRLRGERDALAAEVNRLRPAVAEVNRLRAAPCPHVVTSDDGTSHCGLAEQEVERLRAVLRNHVCHTQGCGCQDDTEGVVAQPESAPATAGTSAGSSPAHPHPYDNCTCCGHYRSEHDEEGCFIEDCGCADFEDPVDQCGTCGDRGTVPAGGSGSDGTDPCPTCTDDPEPDVIEITDDDLLTILRGPLAKADDNAETLVIVDTMALRLALDAWDQAVTERDRLRSLLTDLVWNAENVATAIDDRVVPKGEARQAAANLRQCARQANEAASDE